MLARPESKAKYVDSLKFDYITRIERAMREGWIPDDKAHRAALLTRVAATDVRFFSPFGRMPEQAGGLTQRRWLSTIVALPTITGKQITVHELGHVYARIDGVSMYGYFAGRLGRKRATRKITSLEHLHTILNEGYNDHMTAALIDGHPTTIIPIERDTKGVIETEGSCKLYHTYREIFGRLMGERIVPPQKMT